MRYPSVFIDPAKSKDVELNYILSKVFYQPRGYYQSAKNFGVKRRKRSQTLVFLMWRNGCVDKLFGKYTLLLLDIFRKPHLIRLLVLMSTTKLIYYTCLMIKFAGKSISIA